MSHFKRRLLVKARYELEWFESRLALRDVERPRGPLGRAERPFYLLLARYLASEGSVVYDIGAGTGSFAVAAASSRAVDQVLAFEPHPDSFAKLANRVSHLGGVRVFETALGDVNGSGQFFESNSADSSSLLPMGELHLANFPSSHRRGCSTVSISRLDDLIEEGDLPQPDFIKMDVQGYEDRVLTGGLKTVARAHHCLIELNLASLYEGSALFHDVYRTLCELNFSLVGVGRSVTGLKGETLQFDGVFARNSR